MKNKRVKKRPYQKPTIESEKVFETAALGCLKTLPEGGRCVPYNVAAS